MKTLINILFIIVFPLTSMAQKDSLNSSKDTINLKKQKLLDVHFLGLGLAIHQPINDKYTFTYGVQGGLILNYFPLFYEKEHEEYQLERNKGYLEWFGFSSGIVFNTSNHLEYSIELKLGLPVVVGAESGSDFTSPYGGVSFRVFYKVSANSSIGTNLNFGVIDFDNRPILSISTSFITYRVKINN